MTLNQLHDIGRDILESVIDIAPDGSYNIAAALHLLSKKAPEAATFVTKTLFQLQLDRKWYRNGLKTFERLRHYPNRFDEHCDMAHDQLFEQKLLSNKIHWEYPAHALSLLRWVKQNKTGTCGALASAGMVLYLKHSTEPISIHIISGNNFCHVFLLLSAEPLNRRFRLDDLPEDCLIIDPWLRCKFRPCDATLYWGEILSSLDFTVGKRPFDSMLTSSYDCIVVNSATPSIELKQSLHSLFEFEADSAKGLRCKTGLFAGKRAQPTAPTSRPPPQPTAV